MPALGGLRAVFVPWEGVFWKGRGRRSSCREAYTGHLCGGGGPILDFEHGGPIQGQLDLGSGEVEVSAASLLVPSGTFTAAQIGLRAGAVRPEQYNFSKNCSPAACGRPRSACGGGGRPRSGRAFEKSLVTRAALEGGSPCCYHGFGTARAARCGDTDLST